MDGGDLIFPHPWFGSIGQTTVLHSLVKRSATLCYDLAVEKAISLKVKMPLQGRPCMRDKRVYLGGKHRLLVVSASGRIDYEASPSLEPGHGKVRPAVPA
jgi:hypothetical protein